MDTLEFEEWLSQLDGLINTLEEVETRVKKLQDAILKEIEREIKHLKLNFP